ncbi:Ion channel [Microbulbifer thermotolerans]|uniref:Ion transporter n=1 Tax=Microbulbifer thermotolerans TaxID=252514 RepID=A0A143HLT4_MICTH|nr:potassium channel family protein [Microbulbifer thermotolerans]AMX02467.1 ion transporter [Microbulbifer thermotolerans]MCX2795063.1 potassium channel family protein [Microbulbifer thermotolerans]MCX2836297.1 potassium channel family protein [Microbulbifer thermotolerans]WKT62103.1 potassium channel family protein [Microbulbifer thermotolerans]SFB81844.1 Ion channel [Microbulbifer thermotolerans]
MKARAERRHWRRTLAAALLLAACIFLFHTAVLLEVARNLAWLHRWLTGNYGAANAGRILVCICFFILFLTHIIEAVFWGSFLWRKKMVVCLSDGIYFAASSITALGYGDLVLRHPWRVLGPLVAINGLLMFGCSTAFLFLVLQRVWEQF